VYYVRGGGGGGKKGGGGGGGGGGGTAVASCCGRESGRDRMTSVCTDLPALSFSSSLS